MLVRAASRRCSSGLLVPVLLALAAVAVLAWLGLTGFAWSDYDYEVAPAYLALAHGHLGTFLSLSPAYGGSLVLRAPFAAATAALGGGELAVYRAVSIPCLLAAAAVGVWISSRMRARGRGNGRRALVLLLFLANPLLLPALDLGHPEELLGAALCVGAVIAAADRRATLAGVLLGLAVANKPWALLAVGPVLLALDGHRGRALLVAGAGAALVLAPIALGGASATLTHGAAATGTIFKPWQVWWFLGARGVTIHEVGGVLQGFRSPPSWLSSVAHPLIIAVAAPASLLWRRVRGAAAGEDALLLLALLFGVRQLLDPWDTFYYALPFLLALAAWEGLCREGPPVLTLIATVAAWVTFRRLNADLAPDLQCVSFLVWMAPLLGGLALLAYGRRYEAQENGAEKADRPSLAIWMPNAEMRDDVAFATVSSEPAG
jgi:hypothetical protein